MIRQEIGLLKDVIEAIVHTIKVDSIVNDVDAETSTISTCNTLYLNEGKRITIDDIDYKVDSFSINSEIVLKPVTAGDDLVDTSTTSFTIPTPHFYHGTPRKATTENIADQKDGSGYQGPFIWLLEWVDIDGPEDKFESVVRSTISGASLFILDDCKHTDWNVDDHYTNVIDPMENELNFVIESMEKRGDIFYEIDPPRRRPHVDFGTYVQDRGYERTILAGRLSGVQAIFDIPFIIDPCDCDDLIQVCEPVKFFVNNVSFNDILSGKTKSLSVINQDGDQTGSKVDDDTWQVNTAGSPVSNTINGVSATDTPAGEAQAINVHDDAGADIGSLTTDTANAKTVEVSDATFTVNGNARNGIKPEGSRNVVLVDQDDNPLSSTNLVDSETTCKEEITVPPASPVAGKFIPLSFEGAKVGEYDFSVPAVAANVFNTIKRDSSPQSFDMAIFSEQTKKANQTFVIEWDVLTNNNFYAFIGFGDKANTGINFTDLEFALLGFRSGSNVVWRWFESGTSTSGDIATTTNGDRVWCRIESDGANDLNIYINNSLVLNRTSSWVGSEDLCVKILGRNGNTPVCDHLAFRGVATPDKQVCCLGDSISFGRAVTGFAQHSYIYRMIAFGDHNYYHHILAISGDTASDVISDQSPRLSDLYDATLSANEVNLMIGINDIRSSVPLATIKADIQTIVSDAQSDNFTVNIHTVLKDFTLTAAQESDRVDLNTWIIAGSSGADQVVDHTGNDLETDKALYETDELHPNNNGMMQIALDAYSKYNS